MYRERREPVGVDFAVLGIFVPVRFALLFSPSSMICISTERSGAFGLALWLHL